MSKYSAKIIFLSFLCAVLFTAHLASAANLFFGTDSQTLAVGQEFVMNVYLNTQGQSVNAVGGKIIFPKNLLLVKDIQDGSSVVDYWVQHPDVSQSGIINFSGIITNGYDDNQGLLFSFIFQGVAEGGGALDIQQAQVLKNDGKGTAVATTETSYKFSISPESAGVAPVAETAKDIDLPEIFTPEISTSPDLFDGKAFIVFAAQDKGSGIDHYEVRETGQTGSFESLFGKKQWQVAASPYLLTDQTRESIVAVKAIDKSGNERIVTLPAKNALPWYENYFIWFIIILLGCLLIGYKKWQKVRNQN